MKIFVTGATGFVGSAVVQELLGSGHTVLGLARSDAGAKALEKMGAEVHRGSMEDLDSLRKGTESAEGVIHCGFNHDFSKFQANCEMDRLAIETIGGVLKGSTRPLLVTSGVALLAPGRVATEKDLPPSTHAFPRQSEHASMALAEQGVHASVVRLPPSVHGDGDHGFVPILINLAREKSAAAYVGQGANRWPGVHRLDAAGAYRLALERGAQGERYHVIAEEGVAFREIAGVIGKRLDVPVLGKTPEEAKEYFGWFAMFAGIDAPASSEWTRKTLGWEPKGRGLIADIDNERYF